MNVSIIGAGAMGGAIAEGLVKYAPEVTVEVADPSAETRGRFSAMNVRATADNGSVVRGADVVMVVVKPWLVGNVMDEIKSHLDYSRQILVVVAAGITGADLKEMLRNAEGEVPEMMLVIPNIAVAYKESMTFISPVTNDRDAVDRVRGLFEKLGSVLVVEERLLGAGTTLASCGIAYALRYIRASVEGGVELGFKASEAQKIVVQTVKGAAALLSQSGAHPESEIDKVTTPGGITIRGLNEMERAGFTSSVIRGLKAALKR